MAYNKAYYDTHKEQYQKSRKKYYEEHKEELKRKWRERYKSDESFREAHRESTRQWANNNREKTRAGSRKWYQNNKDKAKEYRDIYKKKYIEKKREQDKLKYAKRRKENGAKSTYKYFEWPGTLFEQVFGDSLFQYDPDMLLSLLPERNREIMYARYRDMKPCREIAQKFGISEQAISSICGRSVKRLSKLIFKKAERKGA